MQMHSVDSLSKSSQCLTRVLGEEPNAISIINCQIRPSLGKFSAIRYTIHVASRFKVKPELL
jgi:hypothetical protein